MKFCNSQWTVFNTENTGLPSNNISSLVIDDEGTKWMGTKNGLAAYNENGFYTSVSPDLKTKNEFSLYPNPASDFITLEISGNHINSNVDVLNIHGQVIKSFRINTNRKQLDVSNFSDGIYLVILQADDNHILKKFVKQ